MLFTAIMLPGCSNNASDPASVTESSITRNELADRIQFLENYVKFRRHYEKLDYNIMYQNNGGGMVPGPSDWDIRLIAVIPTAEIEQWIPVGVEKSERLSPDWLKDLPGDTDRIGLVEWYNQSGTTIGVDREKSIIAYRNTSTPD